MSRLRDNRNLGPSALRRMMKDGIVVAPGLFGGMGAIIAERTGFKAGYLSGSQIAAYMGMPDLSITTLSEVEREVRNITRISSLPLIVDADTGFGESINVERTVIELESAGASAIHIEDQVMPKKCGHLKGKELVSPDDMVMKIKAAVSARKNNDFIIIARTDARALEGIDGALSRSREYISAGADCIFIEALETKDEFIEFRKKTNAFLLANMTEYGKSPLLSVRELEDIGYNIVIFPLTAFRTALKAMELAYSQLKEKGTQAGFLNEIMTRQHFYDLIGYGEYEEEDVSLSKRRYDQ
ncbi:methylisocitrate lyase [Caldiplasma sukawensis]